MQDTQQTPNQSSLTPKSYKIFTISLTILTITLIFITTYLVFQFQQLKKRPAKQTENKASTNLKSLPEKKLEIEGRDLRLKYFQTDTSVFTLLVDYTPKPHTSSDVNVIKVTSLPQQNVISSWEVDFSSNLRPDLALVNLSKIFLSADSRFLIFETVEDGISIYDYQQNKLIRSLDKIISVIEGTNLVKMEESNIILGLFEGWGGVCDENAYKVDLKNLSVTRLQPKESMKKCTP